MAIQVLSFICLVVCLAGPGIASAQDECLPTRCGTGPEIRFPFWLKGRRPDRCGYPGFEISCSATNTTEMELQYPITASSKNIVIPLRVKVRIQEIDYKSQVMRCDYLNAIDCLPRQLPDVNSSVSPFGIYTVFSSGGFTLFNCSASSNDTETGIRYGHLVPCLSSPGYQVRYFDSDYSISEFSLSSCAKMYNVSYAPPAVFTGLEEEYTESYNYVNLNWPKPSCGNCEAQRKYCRLKSNGINDETECVDIPRHSGDETGSSNKKRTIAGVTVALVISVVILVALSVIFILKKRKKDEQKKIEKFLEDYKSMRPIRFSYADIKKITGQFKDKLGQGGYGTVYKGKLSTDILVAVKVLNNFKGNGEEFINEVGTIGRIHHINVVRLVGFCADGYRRALVYEFLPNDCLEKFISSGKQSKQLGWGKLEQIAIGIAKGLDYLHQGCNQRILHFDIKPHNILLKSKF